jgi:hypothetical protein
VDKLGHCFWGKLGGRIDYPQLTDESRFGHFLPKTQRPDKDSKSVGTLRFPLVRFGQKVLETQRPDRFRTYAAKSIKY